jgi:hypothetical protein
LAASVLYPALALLELLALLGLLLPFDSAFGEKQPLGEGTILEILVHSWNAIVFKFLMVLLTLVTN